MSRWDRITSRIWRLRITRWWGPLQADTYQLNGRAMPGRVYRERRAS